jgi:hypothetical protein
VVSFSLKYVGKIHFAGESSQMIKSLQTLCLVCMDCVTMSVRQKRNVPEGMMKNVVDCMMFYCSGVMDEASHGNPDHALFV